MIIEFTAILYYFNHKTFEHVRIISQMYYYMPRPQEIYIYIYMTQCVRIILIYYKISQLFYHSKQRPIRHIIQTKLLNYMSRII